MMFILRQHRKRLELVLMLIIGLTWGILLSQLLHQARFQFSDANYSLMTPQNPDEVIGSSSSSHTLDHSSSHRDLTSMSSLNESESAAERLYKETRVLCMVLTSPTTHQLRAIHIKRTWGARCNKIIFMSSKSDSELNTVVLNVKEGSSNLWDKTRASLKYAFEHHFHQFDWFLKADDDTYVILENLRTFLNAYTPELPVYFGGKLRKHLRDYATGGAGYVLSKEALYRFMTSGFYNGSICNNQNYGREEIELERCLQNVGVLAGDSRDELGLPRFVSRFNYPKMPISNITSNCCSKSAISFHFNDPKNLYVYDYIIYRLRLLGLHTPFEEGPSKKLVAEIL